MEGIAVAGDTDYLKVIVVNEFLESAAPEIKWTVSGMCHSNLLVSITIHSR